MAGARRAGRIAERRRELAGPTGCGLCGVESIARRCARRPMVGAGGRFSPPTIGRRCRRSPAADAEPRDPRGARRGLLDAARGIVAVREDVGRHNALDKLVGALARGGARASDGLLVLTSRVSVELVQKAAAIGAPVVVADLRADRAGARAPPRPPASPWSPSRATTVSRSSPMRSASRSRTRDNHDDRTAMSMSPKTRLHGQPDRQVLPAQGHEQAVAGIAEHIQKFWDPRMRKAIFAHLDAGGAGLDPAVFEAIGRLKQAQPAAS